MENTVASNTVGQFSLVPNPTSNTVLVSFALPEEGLSKATIKIMDIQGKVVNEIILNNPNQFGSANFDLSDVESGVYLVNVVTEGYSETKKLVVSK
jgi:hypothetical protein